MYGAVKAILHEACFPDWLCNQSQARSSLTLTPAFRTAPAVFTVDGSSPWRAAAPSWCALHYFTVTAKDEGFRLQTQGHAGSPDEQAGVKLAIWGG